MSRDEVLAIVKQKARSLLPELDDRDTSRPLGESGLSSLDFVELVAILARELRAKVPRSELSRVDSLDDLADAFVRALDSQAPHE